MNPITDIVFTLSWFILLVWAIRTMSRGWNMDSQSSSYNVEKRTVSKPVHPEMVDVKPGDELMVVNFKDADGDPLHASLQDRIQKLNEQDDDDDDGGDVLVVR